MRRLLKRTHWTRATMANTAQTIEASANLQFTASRRSVSYTNETLTARPY